MLNSHSGRPSLNPPVDRTLDGGGAAATLEKRLCQVVGLNQNYSSAAGTLYHIQVEDRGPVLDRVSEKEVRRVNVIVYANYGEPNARIIYGRDHDFEDVRTHEQNLLMLERLGVQNEWRDKSKLAFAKLQRMLDPSFKFDFAQVLDEGGNRPKGARRSQFALSYTY